MCIGLQYIYHSMKDLFLKKTFISIMHLGFPSWHGIMPAIACLQISILYSLNCCFKLLLKRISDCHSFKLPVFVLWWIQILLFRLQMQSCRCWNPMTLAAGQNMTFIFSLQVSTIVWWKLGGNESFCDCSVPDRFLTSIYYFTGIRKNNS